MAAANEWPEGSQRVTERKWNRCFMMSLQITGGDFNDDGKCEPSQPSVEFIDIDFWFLISSTGCHFSLF